LANILRIMAMKINSLGRKQRSARFFDIFIGKQTIEDRFVPRDDDCFIAQGRGEGRQRRIAVIASPPAPEKGACIQKEQMFIFGPKIDVFLRRRNDAAIFIILNRNCLVTPNSFECFIQNS